MQAKRTLTSGLLSAILCAAALIAVGAGNAHAVVPGANGKILFTRQLCDTDTDPCWELVVANATDTQETVVAGPYERGVFDDVFVANWSPDGHSVIFIADLGTGQAIWQVNADGSGLHKVFAPPTQFLDDGPAFTPDGRWIIFTRCCPRPSGYGLWKVHPDGTDLRVVTTEPVPPNVDGPADNVPQVSPDGRTIVFQHDTATGLNGIATVNFAGGRLRDLAPTDMNSQLPNWSPDGRRIVFQGADDAGIDVWAMNANGTGLTQITSDGLSRNPSYSPDGTKIIFSRIMDDGSRDLFTMNPDGTDIVPITHTTSTERFPQWAPAS